jgi:hypothetical protein
MLTAHLTVPSSEQVAAVNLSVGCHAPPVQPVTCPLVFFMSRMYMSPRTHSPRSRPSLGAAAAHMQGRHSRTGQKQTPGDRPSDRVSSAQAGC